MRDNVKTRVRAQQQNSRNLSAYKYILWFSLFVRLEWNSLVRTMFFIMIRIRSHRTLDFVACSQILFCNVKVLLRFEFPIVLYLPALKFN